MLVQMDNNVYCMCTKQLHTACELNHLCTYHSTIRAHLNCLPTPCTVCTHTHCRPVSRVLCNHCEGRCDAQGQCPHPLLHRRGGLRSEHGELHLLSQDCCRLLQWESCLCGHKSDSTMQTNIPGELHAICVYVRSTAGVMCACARVCVWSESCEYFNMLVSY